MKRNADIGFVTEATTMNTEPVNAYQKQKHFPLEEESAFVHSTGKDQIGLLDNVILDAIAKSEAGNH